jgi:L-ascorbate metabolism protein UlaG (beta-lactamase superfamily)
VSNPEEGLWAWRQRENNNRMLEWQERGAKGDPDGGVELAYYGGCAFKITAPSGISIMIDPWRNHPLGGWDWFRGEFPEEQVDIGLSSHAHFDHDALHRLNANVLLDRLIGVYEFGDVKITGIAEKHVSDSSHSLYDWVTMTRDLFGIDPTPPNNPRCFDNSLFMIETGGLKIVHWGDNRPNPAEHVWKMLEGTDIVLLPVEGSRHILSYEQADQIMERLDARVGIPHHYFIWDLVRRGSTLHEADEWVGTHESPIQLDSGSVELPTSEVKKMDAKVIHFGDNVNFQKPPTAKGPDQA